MFSATDCSINTKFVLSCYQQNLRPGLLVDIRALTLDDCFLYQDTTNYVMAHSTYSQQNKFLIIPGQ
jgi:hypothetical protein